MTGKTNPPPKTIDGKIRNKYEEAKEYFLSIKDTYLKEVVDWEKEKTI